MPDPAPVNVDAFENGFEDRGVRLHNPNLAGHDDDLEPVFYAQGRQLSALCFRRAIGDKSQRNLSITESGDQRKYVLIELMLLMLQRGKRLAGELHEIFVRHIAGLQGAPPRFTAHARAVDDSQRGGVWFPVVDPSNTTPLRG